MSSLQGMSLGFIGAGHLLLSLAKGFISAGHLVSSNVIASCLEEDMTSRNGFTSIGVETIYDNKKVVTECDIAILGVKPKLVPDVLDGIKHNLSSRNLIISVAMGITTSSIEKRVPQGVRVIRVMPNTPVRVGKGASVLAPGVYATDSDISNTMTLFGSVGTCEQIPENLFDAATALSGSGPAYVFMMMEALSDGAVRMGLPRDLAYRLAAQTLIGAGEMMLTTKDHPGVLKDQVTSPAGTTIEGVYNLEAAGVRAAYMKAIQGAALKSKEIRDVLEKL